MWSSIQQIIQPESLEEAGLLATARDAKLLGGGSYLVSQPNPATKTLVDINHLVGDSIAITDEGLTIEAGVSLEALLPHIPETCAQAIKSSCPSRNIRNQRTLGGELAQARLNSDLYVLLLVSRVEVRINAEGKRIPLSEWDRRGVITDIYIPNTASRLERVALLDSAPAFLIVAANKTKEGTLVAVGGQVRRFVTASFSTDVQEEEVVTFLNEILEILTEDHYGSVAYKQGMVSSLLYEMVVGI